MIGLIASMMVVAALVLTTYATFVLVALRIMGVR